MRRGMPELLAIPVVVVVLGLVFVIMFAADAGPVAMVVVGLIELVGVVAFAIVFMRRPRGSVLGSELAPFEGGVPAARDGVHRVLLVIDSASEQNELDGLGAPRGAVVFVVAPAVSSRVARWTGDEQAYARAKEHLDATLQALTGLGLEATGHVGSHDPLQAADEALREFPADEIVFALHGNGETEWIEQGVVDLGRDRYAIPVRTLK
jgi:hypothetical protein